MNDSSESKDSALRAAAKKVVPSGVRDKIRPYLQAQRDRMADRELRQIRQRIFDLGPGLESSIRLAEFDVSFNDALVCYHLYNDMFVNGIYYYEPTRTDPFVLDCGSNIGMSMLYFKHLSPNARVVCFEPDPVLLPYLKKNIAQNNLKDVKLVEAAVSSSNGELSFFADGLIGGGLSEAAPLTASVETKVKTIRLYDYLTEECDFMKMNIEGAEWDALEDAADRLPLIREMAIEYHHLPGLPRTLHSILTLLHEKGFEYSVSDFGVDAYGPATLPMKLEKDTRYFRHIYARRRDTIPD